MQCICLCCYGDPVHCDEIIIFLRSGSTGDDDFHTFIAKFGFNNEGVVVVQVSYRLNIFGFLAISALSSEQGTSGNYGTQDQIMALEWVQKNIASFSKYVDYNRTSN